MANALDRIKQLFQTGTSNAIQAANQAYQRSGIQYAPERLKASALEASGRLAQNLQGGINTVANLPRFSFQESQNPNPVVRTTYNIAKSLPESIINTPRNYFTGIARVGQELGQSYGQQRPINIQNLVAGAAPLAESLIDVGTVGFTKPALGVAKGAVKQATKESLKKAILTGAVKGAGVGGLGGLTYGLDVQYNKLFDLGEVASSVGGGTLLGGVLGGTVAGIGGLKGLITRTPEAEKELMAAVQAYKPGDKLVKPKGLTKAQWDYQLKFNERNGRNPYTPVYYQDIQKEITERLKTGGGGVIKEITPEERARLRVKPTTPEVTAPKFKELNNVPLLEGGTKQVKTRKEALKAMGKTGVRVEPFNPLKPGKEVIILGDGSPKPDFETLRQAQKNIEKQVFGVEIPDSVTKNTKPVGWWTKNVDAIGEITRAKVTDMLQSDNQIVRGIGNAIKGLQGDLAIGSDLLRAGQQMRGKADYGRKLANDIYTYATTSLDKKSLERIHTILDPELYGGMKVNENSLNANEKEVLNLLRDTANWIHDSNFSKGRLSEETWLKNRGKYIARAYEEFEYPKEINDLVKESGLKTDVGQFKKRTDTDRQDFIKDPAYLITKRLQQMFFNDSVDEYLGFIRKSGDVSDIQKPGFVKLSDSKMYGDLSGKWIPKEMMEQVKGFFFSNDFAQKVNEVLSGYDKLKVRQLHKSVLTALNPATRLGNKTFNYLLDFLSGGDPISFAKNRNWASKAIDANDPIYIKALQDGMLGGANYAKSDLAALSQQMLDGVSAKDKGWVSKKLGQLVDSYGKEDEVAKLAKIKEMVDKGYDWNQINNEITRSFQNYNLVGFFYQVASKLPVVGNPFVKFQGDLLRIMRNVAIYHPERFAAYLVATKAIGDLASRMSNETEQDRATRENRPFQPKIPFTNIPLTFQTPIGELNAARLMGPSVFSKLGEDRSVGGDLLSYMPVDPRDLLNDPLLEPIFSVARDKDFRGKPISDPNMSKYSGSLLTEEEKRANQLNYLRRSYTPPALQAVEDVGRSALGQPDFYGRTKTLPQTLLRATTGVKMEQFGPEQAAAAREKQAEYELSGYEAVQRNINTLDKQLAAGEITQKQYEDRVSAQQANIKGTPEVKTKTTYKFVGADGKVKEVNTTKITPPKISGDTTLDKVRVDAFKTDLSSRKKDMIELLDAGKITEEQASKAIKEINDMIDASNEYLKTIKPKKAKAKKFTFKKLATTQSKIKLGSYKAKKFKLASAKIKKLKLPKIKVIKA